MGKTNITSFIAAVLSFVGTFIIVMDTFGPIHRFVDGFPGKLVVIARKSKDAWYIAGINGENIEKNLNLELLFLNDNKTATLITDGKDGRTFNKKEIAITTDKPLKVKLKGNGGFVLMQPL